MKRLESSSSTTTAHRSQTRGKKTRFHILQADYCDYCKFAKGAIMFKVGARNPSELSSHIKEYEVDNDDFFRKFDDIIPQTRRDRIPIIIEEKDGEFKFVGGVYDFIQNYSKK